jgi:hypothetical protein
MALPPGQSGIEVQVDNLRKISEALKALGSNKVLVGIPSENAPRQGEPISNVSLGYIHELGSPARNIPARPFLVPGITKSKDRWVKKLEQAAHDALAGEPGLMKRHLGEAGQIAVNSVKQTIQAGIPPPLQPATVAARRQRTPGSKYRRKATTAADVTPLIDTGSLINSIVWVWG